MNFGLTEILFAIVAVIAAYLGFTTGRKVERPKAIQEGKDQATQEIKTQAMEQTFERVTAANEAAAAVESRTPERVRVEASQDPNNRGRVQRP